MICLFTYSFFLDRFAQVDNDEAMEDADAETAQPPPTSSYSTQPSTGGSTRSSNYVDLGYFRDTRSMAGRQMTTNQSQSTVHKVASSTTVDLSPTPDLSQSTHPPVSSTMDDMDTLLYALRPPSPRQERATSEKRKAAVDDTPEEEKKPAALKRPPNYAAQNTWTPGVDAGLSSLAAPTAPSNTQPAPIDVPLPGEDNTTELNEPVAAAASLLEDAHPLPDTTEDEDEEEQNMDSTKSDDDALRTLIDEATAWGEEAVQEGMELIETGAAGLALTVPVPTSAEKRDHEKSTETDVGLDNALQREQQMLRGEEPKEKVYAKRYSKRIRGVRPEKK
jgi:hypothetical protein